MKYLAIIPARAGSKSIPRKNLLPVAGRPLIAWSISQAKACSKIDRIVVSTDGDDIAAVAREYGAEVPFMRPAEISDDTAATESALLHTVRTLEETEGYRPDSIILLQPTNPVRRHGSLAAAIDLFEARRADSLVSVKEIHPFLWRNADNPVADYDYYNRPRRQDLAPEQRLYEENGSIYITAVTHLRNTGNRLGGQIAMHIMSSNESIDIDTLEDAAVAVALLRSMTE